MEEMNLRNYAYLGDAVWELFVREKTIHMTNNSKKLHQLTTNFVKTDFQCELLHFMEEYLTQEEHEILRRARNLPIPVGRKNMQTQYRQATAFETIIGMWFLFDKPRYEKMLKLLEQKINC
jgi:ribonuclease-3 family protein